MRVRKERQHIRKFVVSASVFWVAALGTFVATAQAPLFTEYPLSDPFSGPFGIASGPDGNVWFAESAGKIGRISPSGVITEFAVNGYTDGITSGPDGNIWFTEQAVKKIGKMTTSGVLLAEFPVSANPDGITAGPDGNVWFTEWDSPGQIGHVGRITPSGGLTEFLISGYSGVGAIAKGPDGNLWVAENSSKKIGRLTTSGVLTEFSIPSPYSYGPGPEAITAGPDGNLWFTEFWDSEAARISTSGTLTEFPINFGDPEGIAARPDGTLWVAGGGSDVIWRVTTSGAITQFPIPSHLGSSRPTGVALGPDGNIWITEYFGGRILKVTPSSSLPPAVPVPPSLFLMGTGLAAVMGWSCWRCLRNKPPGNSLLAHSQRVSRCA